MSLHSGVPLRRRSSYSRQLAVLARALARRGVSAAVRGPRRAGGPAALGRVLLGYPEQFRFLEATGGLLRGDIGPCFLWAQYSRPPRPEALPALGGLTAVPLTEQTAEHLRRGGWRRIGPVIPHGVETRRFRPLGASARRRLRERWELGGAGEAAVERTFVVGAVGAHTARKRLDLVLASFARFASTCPCSLLVVKTDRLRSAEGTDLQALTRRLGIEARVRLVTAELSTAAMAGLYNCFDVLLALAEWEGFGIPVIEAMSCGVPVVTHPGQGPGEIVPYRELLVPGSRRREEGGALLLEARPDLAAEVLGRAREQPQLLRSLAEQGRAEVLRLYDIDRVAARWLTLIDPE